MITIDSFTKKFGVTTAVKNISCTLVKGTITGLLGVNGAGKTTILKAICAIHYPTDGDIFVEGYSVSKQSEQVKECIGYVSEIPSFYPNFTVAELLHFIAQIKHIPRYELEKVIEQCSIKEVLGKKIGILSKGYKQRISFAQALIHNPSVLVLDEPTSGLDPIQIHEMRTLIKSLEQEKTIIVSTHLMQEINAICTNLLVLHNRSLVYDGKVAKVLNYTKTQNLDDAFIQLTRTSNEE